MSHHIDLVGEWVLDPSDKSSILEYGQILLKFSDNGILTYSIIGDDSDEVIILIYEVKNNKIITYQPSMQSSKEETLFSIESGRLRLELNGKPSWYVKLSELEL